MPRGPMARGVEPTGTATGRTIERNAMNEVIKENLSNTGSPSRCKARKTVLSLYSELAIEIHDCGQQFREAGIRASDVMLWLISKCREELRGSSETARINYVKEMRMMVAQMMACEIAEGRTEVLSKGQFKASDPWLHRIAGSDTPELSMGDQLSLADKAFNDIPTG